MLVRAVIVRAIGGDHIHAKGVKMASNNKVGSRFGSTVRTVRRIGGLFSKQSGFT